jgi:hypothetical protein
MISFLQSHVFRDPSAPFIVGYTQGYENQDR